MVVKSQLKIDYEKTHNTLFFTSIIIKNEYTRKNKNFNNY